MQRMTGQPGWMRFGFSPGWAGRSESGLGPCAQMLMAGGNPFGGMGAAGGPGAPTDKAVQLEMLRRQAEAIARGLASVQAQIVALEAEE